MLECWDVYPVKPGSPSGCVPCETDEVSAEWISLGFTGAGILVWWNVGAKRKSILGVIGMFIP